MLSCRSCSGCLGGPGAEAPRPTESSGWLQKAVQYFHVVMLDQRGTGKSGPITASTVQQIGGPQAQANYLQHFRLARSHSTDSLDR